MRNKKGFTLAELLIVVAIIAVLVAIAIPIFVTQLEKAREATDAANLRAAYAEAMAYAIENNTAAADAVPNATVEAKQTISGWATSPEFPANFTVGATTSSAGSWTLTYDKDASGQIKGVIATFTAS